MKKKYVIVGAAAIVLIAAIVLAIVFTREGVVVKSGAVAGGLSYVENDIWKTTASKINGYCRVDKTFDSDNLATFHVNGTNNGGKVFLIMSQGDIERTIEITGEYDKKIDMSEFTPGRVRLRLDFENAEDIHILISWK